MTLGNLIRARRTALDMSLDDLAGAIGASKSSLSRIETGRVEPGIALCARLAVALGLSVQVLASAALAGAVGPGRR